MDGKKGIPETIFLQVYGDSEQTGGEDEIRSSDVTWSEERIYPTDVEYHRSKLPWISVKERMPEVDEKNISMQSKPVLVLLASQQTFEPKALVYNKHYHVWDSEDGDDFECEISDGDFWAPIPTFDEILEANKDILKRLREK